MESVTKSIIYGNPYENRYGRFMPVCSSISDRASIQSILDYLHDTPHFRKYNRNAYAYRVEEVPVVFITEKKNVENQHFDGCHSDQTIEGSGQKLLHLLQKFNIRNVLIVILVQQFNPLMPFETTNYRAIVENCRVLLDELYKKVVALQDQAELKSFNDLLLHNNQASKLKKCNVSQNVQIPAIPNKKALLKQRPNHIYTHGKPQFLGSGKVRQEGSNGVYQIKFLWQRCKLMKGQFQSMAASLDEKEIEQLRYYVMYDKNVVINQVIKLLTIYLGIDKNYLVNQFKFQLLREAKVEAIEDKTLKKLQDYTKSNKKLSVDAVMKISRPIGIVFSMIDIKIRFSKTLRRVSQLMERCQFDQKDMEEVQRIKQKTTQTVPVSQKHRGLNRLQKSVASSMSEKKVVNF